MNHSDFLIASLVNGKACQTISLLDRGLNFGDGVFETIRVQSGMPCLWRRHRERLQKGCHILDIPLDAEALDREVQTLCASAEQDAVLKIIVTRGESHQGYRIPDSAIPTRILMLIPPRLVPTEHQQGIAVKICEHRLSCSRRLAKIKHLNRLDQILASKEWQAQYQEGLMLDEKGRVIEGTMSNLFICRGNSLLTPSLEECGIAGVMRGHLIDQSASIGLTAAETDIYPDDIFQSDGAFLSNSLIGVLPINRIEETPLTQPSMIDALQTLAKQA